jgi:thioester reductase-like protein
MNGNGHIVAGNGGNGHPTHDVSLVTGFPAFTARRLVERLLARTADDRVLMLVRDKFKNDAVAFQALLPPSSRARLRLVEGDVADMDLGLPGPDYKTLAAEVTQIHHTAAVYYLGAKRDLVERVNVDGTRTMLELAADCTHLRRFVHWSTSQVSGARSGVILEEELDCGQRFRNVYEETKFRAERMVRDASRRLPVTILRPGIIVGDSKTGEIDKFDGPYYLLVLIVSSPIDVHLPLPGRGSAPLNLVPIDYVVESAIALSRDPRAIGGTFHLTDPAPFSARTVYELVAQRADKKAPRGMIPTGLARALLKAPGLERLARAPLAFLEAFNHLALYNCRHTLTLLSGDPWHVRCPPFDSYVDPLVRYVREVQARKKQARDDEAVDPLDMA